MKKLLLIIVLILSQSETFAQQEQEIEQQKPGLVPKKQEFVCMVDSKKQTREVRFDLSLPDSASRMSTRVLEKEGIKLILDESYRSDAGRISEILVQLPHRAMQTRFVFGVNAEIVDDRESSKVKICRYEESSIENVFAFAIPKLTAPTKPAKPANGAYQSTAPLVASTRNWDFLLPENIIGSPSFGNINTSGKAGSQ